MLFDRHFWLAKAVGALPSCHAADAVDLALARVARARAPARPPWRRRRPRTRGGTRAAPPAAAARPRCAVCVVQKKGRCGTDTAPARCLRRGGRGRADALEDPFDDASASGRAFPRAAAGPPRKPASEVGAERVAPLRAERGGAGVCAAAAADAASGGFHRSDRVYARRRAPGEAPRGGGRAPRRAGKGRRAASRGIEPFLASSSSSSSSPSRRASRYRRRRSWRTSRRRWTGTRRTRGGAARRGGGLRRWRSYELMWQIRRTARRSRPCSGACKKRPTSQGGVRGGGGRARRGRRVHVQDARGAPILRRKRDAPADRARRAAASPAASSRVGAQRPGRGRHGTLMRAPAHGARWAALDDAARRRRRRRRRTTIARWASGRDKPKTAAAAAAAAELYGVCHGRRGKFEDPAPSGHLARRRTHRRSANTWRGSPATGGAPARRGTARLESRRRCAGGAIARRISSARHPAPAGSSPSRRRRPRLGTSPRRSRVAVRRRRVSFIGPLPRMTWWTPSPPPPRTPSRNPAEPASSAPSLSAGARRAHRGGAAVCARTAERVVHPGDAKRAVTCSSRRGATAPQRLRPHCRGWMCWRAPTRSPQTPCWGRDACARHAAGRQGVAGSERAGGEGRRAGCRTRARAARRVQAVRGRALVPRRVRAVDARDLRGRP